MAQAKRADLKFIQGTLHYFYYENFMTLIPDGKTGKSFHIMLVCEQKQKRQKATTIIPNSLAIEVMHCVSNSAEEQNDHANNVDGDKTCNPNIKS